MHPTTLATVCRLTVFALLTSSPTWAAATTAGETAGSSVTHQMMMLVIQLGLLLFATRLGNVLFERLRLPGVLGELAAGMVLGPFVLGALALPGFPDGIFPTSANFPVSPELYGFCAVAAIILLFMVGLETNIRQFLRYSVAGSAVGIGGVAISFLGGAFVTSLFSPYVFGVHLSPMDPQCLFLGVISTATSVGITARILAEKRKLDTPEGLTILSGAVIDDVLGIILLTVVIGVATASKASGRIDWTHISIIALKAVTIWLVATVAGLLLAHQVGGLLKRFRGQTHIAVMSFGLALILAGLFEEAGLAMIIGAYIMGLSLSRTDIAHVVREQLSPVYAFLVPIFFGVMGMLVDFSALGNRKVLVFGLVYSVVAVLAKILGSGLPALAFGFNLRGAARIGTGMIPRGEVALIVAGIGLAAGVLSPDVFGVAILMTVLTTVIAPPALLQLFKKGGQGLKPNSQPQSHEHQLHFSFPSPTLAKWVFSQLQQAFLDEGFYVHALEHDFPLRQARLGSVAISFSCEQDCVAFTCSETDTPLVQTAVRDVLGELEKTIRGLQKPLDVPHLLTHPASTSPAPAGTKRHNMFSEALSPERLTPQLHGTTKVDVITELLDLLCNQNLVRDRDAALRDLLAREESMPTGLQAGLAVPHARTAAVDTMVACVGVAHQGIDFEAVDGQLSTVIVLVLSPSHTPAPHLQFMAAASQALSPETCAHLLNCTAPEAMFAVLTQPPSPKSTPTTKIPRTDRKQCHLANHLDARHIAVPLAAKTKPDAIRELLALLQDANPHLNLSARHADIMAREKQMSTGLENGVAVPHCRTDEVTRITCAIGVSPEGIPFQSIDGEPAHIVILTLAPISQATPYLQVTATLIRAVQRAGNEQLVSAPDAETVLQRILQSHGLQIA